MLILDSIITLDFNLGLLILDPITTMDFKRD